MMQLPLPNDPLVPTLALVIPRYGAVCATLPDDYIWKVLQVLCTGSKPNSNACSMRGGECRHFASAFASARLALPGPEEKSIVSSTISIAADKSPFCGNQAHATTSS